MNAGHHRRFVVPQLRGVGKILLVVPKQKASGRGTEHEQNRAGGEQEPYKPRDKPHETTIKFQTQRNAENDSPNTSDLDGAFYQASIDPASNRQQRRTSPLYNLSRRPFLCRIRGNASNHRQGIRARLLASRDSVAPSGPPFSAPFCGGSLRSRARKKASIARATVPVALSRHSAETRVETSSGYPRLDDANVACIREAGRVFTPQLAGQTPTGAWQSMSYRWVLGN